MKPKKSNKANLENKRSLFIEVGLILSLALLIAAFSWSSNGRDRTLLSDSSIDVPEEWDAKVELPVEALPPPPVPVVSDVLIISDDPDLTSPTLFFPTDNFYDPIPDVPYIAPKRIIDTVTIIDDPDISTVQEKPTFMGGDYMNFPKWVQQNVVYPQSAIENGQEGKVYLRFRIGKDGKVSDVQVLRAVSSTIDAEATRVILSSPKWSPAKQNNKPVAVLFTIPVTFRLQH